MFKINKNLIYLLVGSFLVVISGIIRIIPAWELKAVVNDIAAYQSMANIVARGDNIYAQRILFPYMPFSQFHPMIALKLAEATGWGFDFAIKLSFILGDIMTTGLIFAALLLAGQNLKKSAIWTLFWVFNPVAILISAFHGNIMSDVATFIVASVVAAQGADKTEDRLPLVALSGLLLGIGVALRTFPLLMWPVFIVLFTRNIKEAILFTVLTLLPASISAIPYLWYVKESFLAEVGGYGGFTDFGWVSILRSSIFLIYGKRMFSNYDDVILRLTQQLFLYSYGIIGATFVFFNPKSLAKALAIPCLLFYSLYAGASAQYFVWVLPLALITRSRWAIIFTLICSIALISFYSIYAPGILVGRFGMSPLDSKEWAITFINVLSNGLLEIICFLWVGSILWNEYYQFCKKEWNSNVFYVKTLRGLWSNHVYISILIITIIVMIFPLLIQIINRAYAVWKVVAH